MAENRDLFSDSCRHFSTRFVSSYLNNNAYKHNFNTFTNNLSRILTGYGLLTCVYFCISDKTWDGIGQVLWDAIFQPGSTGTLNFDQSDKLQALFTLTKGVMWQEIDCSFDWYPVGLGYFRSFFGKIVLENFKLNFFTKSFWVDQAAYT